MLPVEIVPVDGTTLVLRARGSELLILPQHIGELKNFKTPKDFTGYFLENALLNRPARKLFEAWLRKDRSLWQRIYKTIQSDMDADKIAKFEQDRSTPKDKPQTEAPKKAKAESAPVAKEKKVAAETKSAAAPKKAAPAKSAAEDKKSVAKKVKADKPKAAAKPAEKAKAAPAKKKAAPASKTKAKGK